MNILFTTETTIGTAFLTYQFKVALILVCFYLFYRLLMSKETFHKLNRFLLTSMVLSSFFLPFCVFTIHRYVPAEEMPSVMSRNAGEMAVPMSMVPDFTFEQDANAVSDAAQNVAAVEQALPSIVMPEKPARTVNWWIVALTVWFAGFVFHLSRTALSIIQVRRIIRTGRKVSSKNYINIYVVEMNISPFSWIGNIVMSREDYESDNRDVIIDHEMTHVRLGHSYDLMMVDLLSSMQWFNPVTSMLRKDLQDVHEFQADGCVLSEGYDAKEYQYMLLGKVASMNGFSVTNHFKKQNLSNRIRMMNRKDSKFARAFKALYAPLLVGLVIISFAVTVYDCKPDSQSQNKTQSSSGNKRNVDVLRDSMEILDQIYGQGKFNRFPWETGAVWLTEGDTVIVRTGDRVEAVMKPEEVADYLLDYKGFNTHRITIVLSKLNGDQTTTGLMRARPLVDMLNEVGIYALVVKSDAEWREAYYSTYKYGRIYTWTKKGVYELDHNGLIVHGTPQELTDWIKALDIEYIAFFPDDRMPWSDASIIMKAAYERGSRTFSINICESPTAKSALEELLGGKKNNGEVSRALKENGYYLTTILPTKRDLDKEFKGKTVMEVESRIRAEYTTDFLDQAKKVVHSPQVYYSTSDGVISDISFGENETVVILDYRGLGRNVWSRPGDFSTMKLVANGKEYSCVANYGHQNFADYPWVPEYEYANGSFCWVPERGHHLSTFVFEPVPADVNRLDLLDLDLLTGKIDYLMRGINVSGNENLFDGIQLLRAGCYMELELEGTTNRNSLEVYRIEVTPDETTVFMDLLVRADFSYPGQLGSDLTLVLNDGTKVKINKATVPLDEDFDRGGDHMLNHLQLMFPTVDINKILPNNEKGTVSKLEGTICHKKFELPLNNVAFIPSVK
ncbi:MAG: M56 family metallopeptidase [Bacteroidaceae bacterium]|nr:M56 family metallopeptidase [Bacteroidaceae bacterium]